MSLVTKSFLISHGENAMAHKPIDKKGIKIFFILFHKNLMWLIRQGVSNETRKIFVWRIVCVEVLRPSQPNGVMSSMVSLRGRVNKQEAHGPRFAHLSDIATADMQMLCNIFPILSSQLMKISSFEQFLVLKKNILT